MTYLSHWIPTFAAVAVLAIAGFILIALENREARRRSRGPGGGPRAN